MMADSNNPFPDYEDEYQKAGKVIMGQLPRDFMVFMPSPTSLRVEEDNSTIASTLSSPTAGESSTIHSHQHPQASSSNPSTVKELLALTGIPQSFQESYLLIFEEDGATTVDFLIGARYSRGDLLQMGIKKPHVEPILRALRSLSPPPSPQRPKALSLDLLTDFDM